MTRKYWCNRDERQIYRWRGDHGKFMAYKMISISCELFFRSHDAFDGPTFLKYVKDAVTKYGRILIIAGKARRHRMIKLEEYLPEKRMSESNTFKEHSPQHDIIEII